MRKAAAAAVAAVVISGVGPGARVDQYYPRPQDLWPAPHVIPAYSVRHSPPITAHAELLLRQFAGIRSQMLVHVTPGSQTHSGGV